MRRMIGFATLEGSPRELQYRIDYLEYVKQEAVHGTVSGESQASLVQNFPDEFALPEETQGAEQSAADLVASKDDRRQMVAPIDEQLRRLASEREKVAASEALHVESKIRAAALPVPAALDKLIRYETASDRALDRALRRLEGMQARRRQRGGAPAKP